MVKTIFLLSFILLLTQATGLSQCSFSITLSVTNVTCNNGTNGYISASVSGGTSPYQYQLAEGTAGAWQTANAFTGLAAATYPLSVKDATGCISTVYATVKQPAAVSVSYTTQDPTCSGSSNGSINIVPAGGTSPYTFAWTNNGSPLSTSQNLSGLSAGNYGLIVTDALGCTGSPVITAQVRQIGMTGFNEDVVADGTNVAANVATTRPIDQSAGNVLYAAGYTNSSGTSGAYGLPSNRTFTSAQDVNRSYQLAPYSASNALLLRSSTDASNGGAQSGTLTFNSNYQSPYSAIYVVGTTGSGTGTVSYSVNFSDNSTQTGSITFQDWSLASTSASTVRALGALDRVSRASPGTFSNSTSFNLFEAPITIPAGSQSKSISTLTLTWSGSSNARTSVMAATGYTSTASGIRINDGPSTNATPSVTVGSDASSNQFCSGQLVTFTATPTNGGSSPTYQWKVNGANAGSNSTTFTSSSLNNNDQITVVMTASGGTTCLSLPTATSAAVQMVQSAKSVGVSATTSSNPACSGSTVAFTASASNEGASPSYQWKVNGAASGSGSSFSSSSLTNNDQVTVTLTSSIGCATNNPAVSSPIVMSIQSSSAPTATISSVPAVTFSSSVTFAGSAPAYQWYKNGSAIAGATSNSYSTNSGSAGDVFSMKLTSSYFCKTSPSAMSNYVTVTSAMLPVLLTSFTARASGDAVYLQWTTEWEQHNNGFAVQTKNEHGDFVNIGFVAAARNLSGESYEFVDYPKASGYLQYRLAQVDLDGKKTYSTIQGLRFTKQLNMSVSDAVAYWKVNNRPAVVSYSLLDMQGRMVAGGRLEGSGIVFKPGIAGWYCLKISSPSTSQTFKVVK